MSFSNWVLLGFNYSGIFVQKQSHCLWASVFFSLWWKIRFLTSWRFDSMPLVCLPTRKEHPHWMPKIVILSCFVLSLSLTLMMMRTEKNKTCCISDGETGKISHRSDNTVCFTQPKSMSTFKIWNFVSKYAWIDSQNYCIYVVSPLEFFFCSQKLLFSKIQNKSRKEQKQWHKTLHHWHKILVACSSNYAWMDS